VLFLFDQPKMLCVPQLRAPHVGLLVVQLHGPQRRHCATRTGKDEHLRPQSNNPTKVPADTVTALVSTSGFISTAVRVGSGLGVRRS
jgi:hypothetical protein